MVIMNSSVSLLVFGTMVSFRRLTNVTLNMAAVAKSPFRLGAAANVDRIPHTRHVRMHKVFNGCIARLN
jgi:hypothetical protein